MERSDELYHAAQLLLCFRIDVKLASEQEQFLTQLITLLNTPAWLSSPVTENTAASDVETNRDLLHCKVVNEAVSIAVMNQSLCAAM